MSRIFPTLAVVAVISMLVAFGLGWVIEDARSIEPAKMGQVTLHMFVGLGALVFVSLVHSIILTYFMGTGRWLEETCKAYSLGDEYFAASKRVKYRVIPMMVFGIFSLVMVGAVGAMADPASGSKFTGWFGLDAAKTHFAIAATAITLNLLIHFMEFQAVRQNVEIINMVLADVHRIRTERGLPTDPVTGSTTNRPEVVVTDN